MHIVFVSNFFNHHQESISNELDRLTNHHYTFIATIPMSEERKKMGWGTEALPSYVIESYRNDFSASYIQDMILSADIVIWGAISHRLLQKRINKGLLTFWYSERLYKVPCPHYRIPQKTVTMYYKFGRHKNLHLLCASAFASADFSKTHTFSGRRYKWGYFPFTERYSEIESIILKKKSYSILWVARMIDWKHPEIPVQLAKLLKEANYSVSMTLIGNGEKQDFIKKLISDYDLKATVQLIDSLTPENVRKQMEQSEIFIATSDRNEGWGAVVNEAMNSGCAVVASHAIGSVPFLIQDETNGIIFKDGDIQDLFHKVVWLLDNPIQRQQIGINAYYTIAEQWNAQNAASRLLTLSQCLLAGENTPFSEGVCSNAEIIEDNWYVNENSLFNTMSSRS